MRYFLLLLPLLLCQRCIHADAAVYSGTAFVVHPDGFLLTCNHVVQGATDIQVLIDGKSYTASVLQEDEKHDLALLQIGLNKLTALPLTNSNQVQLGEEVRACGFPLASVVGTDLKVTRGTISGITTIGVQKVFQVDAPINAGNSGGPLINEKGEVVGVVNAKLAAPDIEGVGFTVPINYARRLLDTEGIEITAGKEAEKLDGPTLVKRVSTSIAFVKATVDEEQQAGADILRAQAFELVDGEGKVTARLSTLDGGATLILFDGKGVNRAQIALGEGGEPSILLTDAADVMRMQLAVDTDNLPSIMLCDTGGNTRSYLRVNENGLPSFRLSDAEENTRAVLRLDDDNTPSLEYYDDQQHLRTGFWLLGDQTPALSYYDKEEHLRGLLGMNTDDTCRLNFTDADEALRAYFGVDAKGVPLLMMADTEGVSRAELTVTEGAPSLSMNNADGAALAMLTVTDENVPSLAMGNDADHMTMQMCVAPDGFSELEMRDQNNVIRALMSVHGNGDSVISLSDAGAHPRIWTRMKNETPLFGVQDAGGDFNWSAP